MHFQTGAAAGGGGAQGGGGDQASLQQKLQRQRQLGLERQRAAAARQRLGVGVVAQSNPLSLAAADASGKASGWGQLPDSKASDKSPMASPHADDAGRLHGASKNSTLCAAGAAAAMGSADVMAATSAKSAAATSDDDRGGAASKMGKATSRTDQATCTKGHPLKEIVNGPSGTCDECSRPIAAEKGLWACHRCDWCLCRGCFHKRSGKQEPATAGTVSGIAIAKKTTAGLLDEMQDGLDVEELVDQLHRQDTSPSREEEQPPRSGQSRRGPPIGAIASVGPLGAGVGAGPGGSRARPRPSNGGGGVGGFGLAGGGDADHDGPVGGAWGVDAGLQVQGPPPAVVQVAGFDDPGGEGFASPARRADGRRRPPPQGPDDGDADPTIPIGPVLREESEGYRLLDEDDDDAEWPKPDAGRPSARPAEASWDLGADPEVDARTSVEKTSASGRRWWKPWQQEAAAPLAATPEVAEVTQISAFSVDD